MFSYRDKVVIVGGDSTGGNWTWRRDRFERSRRSRINAHVVNLPHHGSKIDCSPAVLKQLFTSDGGTPRFAITSANGQSHPDLEVIEELERMGIHPYCTNLLPNCGASVTNLRPLQDLEPELARWLREVSTNSGLVQPCQGDIIVRIDGTGQLSVAPEFARPCGFRGDYDSLLSGL